LKIRNFWIAREVGARTLLADVVAIESWVIGTVLVVNTDASVLSCEALIQLAGQAGAF
jgi:late competence protein required for DNA uptake (superfamily II DNA/RNA helicase)